jgi:hypothetical protein
MGSYIGNELWTEIEGYEGKYFISTRGQVYSFKSNRKLAIKVDSWGYPCVSLYDGEKIVMHKIHRLLAKAFIDNQHNKPCVNHIDGNKENNDISNLEWVTHSENTLHSKRVLKQNVGGDHHKARLVIDSETGIFYDTIAEAAWAKGVKPMNLVGWLSGHRTNRTSLRYA